MHRDTIIRVAIVALVLIALAGIGYALLEDVRIGEDTYLESDSETTVVLGEDADLTSDAVTPLFPADDPDVVDLDPHGTIRSAGDVHVRAAQISDDDGQVILEDIDLGFHEMDVDFHDYGALTLSGGIDRLAYDDYGIDEGGIAVDADGSWTLTVTELEADVPVLVMDGEDMIDMDRTDSAGELTFSGDSGTYELTLVEAAGPEFVDDTVEPDPDVTIEDDPLTLGIDVSHPDGLDITATFTVEGEEVGQDTIQDGEGRAQATVDVSDLASGENTWSVELADELGSTATFTSVVQNPAELVIRDEISTDIIDDPAANVTVRFFEEDEDVVVTRETEDGIVNMSGLDTTSRFIVSVNADEYIDRQILVESLIQQQNVFVLPEGEDMTFNEFVLEDRTDQFPPDESILIIERPIQLAGEDTSSYRAIAGDEFGADRRVPVDLLRGERYRIIVENDEGERRSLGSYTAESDGTVDLHIGSVSWPAPESDANYGINLQLIEGEDEEDALEVTFSDPDGNVDMLEFEIQNRFDENDVIYEDTVFSPDEYQAIIPLEDGQASEQWAMDYTVTMDGEDSDGYILIGGDTAFGIPIDGWWLNVLVMITLTVMAAMYPADLASLGAVVVVAFAGVFMLLGWAQIPVFAWFIAGAIAMAGVVRARHRGGVGAV